MPREIHDLSHLKAGDAVCIDASRSSIHGTKFIVYRGTVEKTSPTGHVTVKVNDSEKRFAFLPSNVEKGDRYGANIVSEEEFARVEQRAANQALELAAEQALHATRELSLRRHSRADILAGLRAAISAVEAVAE